MDPLYFLIPIFFVVAAVGLYFIAPRAHDRLGAFWVRRCEGRAWRRTFPTASNEEIRRFLELFMDAFAMPRGRMLRFAPTDRIFEIYRAFNPPGWPDALELETLDKLLSENYGLRLNDCWKESLSLGELFARARRVVV
jgi:hypothetical protein